MKGRVFSSSSYYAGFNSVTLRADGRTVTASNGKSVSAPYISSTTDGNLTLTTTGGTGTQSFTVTQGWLNNLTIDNTAPYLQGQSNVTLSVSGRVVTASNSKTVTVPYYNNGSSGAVTVTVSSGTGNQTFTPSSGGGWATTIAVNNAAAYNGGYSAAQSGLTIARSGNNVVATGGGSSKTYTPTTGGGTKTITTKAGSVTVAAYTYLTSALTVNMSASTLTAANIRKGITILGIGPGTWEGYLNSVSYIYNAGTWTSNSFTNTYCASKAGYYSDTNAYVLYAKQGNALGVLMRTTNTVNLSNYNFLKLRYYWNSSKASAGVTSKNYTTYLFTSTSSSLTAVPSSGFDSITDSSNGNLGHQYVYHNIYSISESRYIYVGLACWGSSYTDAISIYKLFLSPY